MLERELVDRHIKEVLPLATHGFGDELNVADTEARCSDFALVETDVLEITFAFDWKKGVFVEELVTDFSIEDF